MIYGFVYSARADLKCQMPLTNIHFLSSHQCQVALFVVPLPCLVCLAFNGKESLFDRLSLQASLSEGDSDSNLTRITVAGLFLRCLCALPV